MTSPPAKSHPALLLAFLVVLATALPACGPQKPLHTVSWGGQPGFAHMVSSRDGELYFRDRDDVPTRQPLLAIVGTGDQQSDEQRYVTAVLMPEENNPPWSPVVEIAAAGNVELQGDERYLRLEQLPDGPLHGLAVAHFKNDELHPVTESLPAGWYWIVAMDEPALSPLGFGRFASGLVRMDAQRNVVHQVGNLVDDSLLVRAETLASGDPAPVRVAVDEAIPAQAELMTELERLAELSGIPLVAQSGGRASDAHIIVSLQENQIVLETTDPEFFAIQRWGHSTRLGLPGILEHPLSLPADSATPVVLDSVLGLVALAHPLEPLAGWLLENATRKGLTMGGSSTSMLWRLTELYALAGHWRLALSTIAALGDENEATRADAWRYRARALHLTLAWSDSTDRRNDALVAYDRAINSYRVLGFDLGVAAARSQQADLLDATGAPEEAAELRNAAAASFAAAGAHKQAAVLYLEMATTSLVSEDPETAAVALDEGLEQANRGDLLALQGELTGWKLVANQSEEALNAMLQQQDLLANIPDALRAYGEARLEALSGRTTQSGLSFIEAAELAAADNVSPLVVLAARSAREQIAESQSGPQAARLVLFIERNASASSLAPELRRVQRELCTLSLHQWESSDALLACVGAMRFAATSGQDEAIPPMLHALAQNAESLAASGSPQAATDAIAGAVEFLSDWSPGEELTAQRRQSLVGLATLQADIERRDGRALRAVAGLDRVLIVLDPTGTEADADIIDLRLQRLAARVPGGQLSEARKDVVSLKELTLTDSQSARLTLVEAKLAAASGELEKALEIADESLAASPGMEARLRMQLVLLAAQLRSRIAADAARLRPPLP